MRLSDLRLKKTYSAREVAALTGLTARQLEWWDARGLFRPTVPSRRTSAGGFTERRYSPIDLYELFVLADLRRRGFSVHRIRLLLDTLRRHFGVRLFDTIRGDGPLTLLSDGRDIYARTARGDFLNLLQNPRQPLLAISGSAALRELGVRVRARRRKRPGSRGHRGTEHAETIKGSDTKENRRSR